VKNERYTENLLEQELRKKGFDEAKLQFQGSYDPDIQAFLPSKRSGKDGKGKSEFIIRLNGDAADLLVVECKADTALHASAPNLSGTSDLKPVHFAEDGVLHYMKGLKRDFNVIGLAVSGTEKLKITTFKALRNGDIERLPTTGILDREDYVALLRRTCGYGQKSEAEIASFAKELHEFLRDSMELKEENKPVIVSGILLALMDQTFEESYRSLTNCDDLAEALLGAIRRTLKKAKVREEKMEAMEANYQFIKTDKSVKKHLAGTISRIYRHLYFALQPTSSLDMLGNFYAEFLRYSGGDQKGLGKVLTPRHVTELFAELADLDPAKSVVLDICTGTAGFLIAAMARMFGLANGDKQLQNRIKDKGLIGVELDSHMFTLACANMIFRGDGKSNMFWDDCLSNRDRDADQVRESLVSTIESAKKQMSRDEIEKAEEVVAALRSIRLDGAAKQDSEIDRVKILMADLNLGKEVVRTLEALKQTGETDRQIKSRGANVAMLNPPYAKKLGDKHELAFILKALDLLEQNGTCIAIIPMSCIIEDSATTQALKRELLESHTLRAVMSMPDQLFQPQAATTTAIVVFTAHKPHNPKRPTWFGYWKDDGYTLSKNRRVERAPGIWAQVKANWLGGYLNEREVDQVSCKQAVTAEMEWCAEAYLKTDYSALTKEHFEEALKQYAIHLLRHSMLQRQDEQLNQEIA